MPDENGISQPVDQPLPKKKHRQCNGARLGNKRYEVEWLLKEGVSKLEIARRLKISAHSVRAVARQMEAQEHASYAPPSGASVNLPAVNPPVSPNLPELLREKARLTLDGVNAEKIQKASLSSLALATDRLLNRAEAIENRGTNLTPFMEMWEKLGVHHPM